MEDCLQIVGLCLVYGFKMVDRASRWLAYGRKWLPDGRQLVYIWLEDGCLVTVDGWKIAGR
jgi:hypothetical protein